MTEPTEAESGAPSRFTRLWKRVPPRLLGGRFRTTTVVMCVLWLGLSILNGYLNPTPPPVTETPAPAGVEQGTYIPPAPAEKSSTQPSTSTSESSAPSETSGTSSPSPTPPSGSSGTSSATTTPGEQREPPPFQFPWENRTTPSETSQSEPVPTETTPRNDTTVVPSPEG